MFDKNAFVDFLKQEFPEGSVVSGGNEFLCRCRFCGDSATNPYKRRFYISLNHPDKVIYYHCFNCDASGILTPQKLKMLCDAPVDLLLDLASYNKVMTKSIVLSGHRQPILVPETLIDDEFNKAKLNYLNERLALNLNYEDYSKLKIIFSLGSLINNNRLSLTKSMEHATAFDKYFIGFLGMNNNNVNGRNIAFDQGLIPKVFDKRYLNYPLFADIDNSKRFYSIPTISDMRKSIRINIAEGPFDVLSIFFHLRNKNTENEIYTAAGSQAYVSVIKMFLTEFGLLDCEFHIYMDNDVADDIKRRIKELTSPIGIPVYIHNNAMTGEKDFGVPVNRIKDVVFTL